MNIEERIQGMSGDELERLLKCLNFTLSARSAESRRRLSFSLKLKR